ncbi:hypothetical protein DPMN_094352 [Dreissena polymorpha]|uniref:Uncharacterized protein n=1 Tax=Dreissena polymorpha TaxID=45954 RepID=A0A9D4R3G4_DREPO|nr:hypothetical protein DPMN_094352 [Dreissena polymorpha]
MYRNRYWNERFKSKVDIKPAESGFEAENSRDCEMKALLDRVDKLERERRSAAGKRNVECFN